MSREIKIIKDKDGNDIEVYSDKCNMCSAEMVFPKDQVDQIESMFPFIKEKAERGSPCVECIKKEGEKGISKILSSEELEEIKRTVMNLNKNV